MSRILFKKRCFEFDAKFPSDSQLTISIRNKSFLNLNELIGQTSIDLENRFYSDQYARCGLPKRYELIGYNAWRDLSLPRDILAKYCKKFNLLPPEIIKFQNKIVLKIYDWERKLVYERSYDITVLDDLQDTAFNFENDTKQLRTENFNETSNLNKKYLTIEKVEDSIIFEQLALDCLNQWVINRNLKFC